MTVFTVGTEVKLSDKSEYWHKNTPSNPRGISGKVIELTLCPVIPIRVEWSNSETNSYSVDDLTLVKAPEVKRHEPKQWVYRAYALKRQGMSSLEISKLVGKPSRTVRHNLQIHGEFLASQASTPISQTKVISVSDRPTIFVIPDTQCKQGISLDYLHHIGHYIARKKPEIIVHLGDHYDMASLSTYDKGQLSAEGRRVKADIDAGDAGIEILEQYINSIPDYKPRKVVTLGNHEDRIDRYVKCNPEFEGLIGTQYLAFKKHGWEVYPFLTPVNICDINFVHYLPNTMTGKPMGGTALSRLKNVGSSFVMGHVQTYDFCQRPLQLTGQHQIGLIAGACYPHDEGYKGVQGNHHFRGCLLMYECEDGYAMHAPITLRHMQEVYEREVIK